MAEPIAPADLWEQITAMPRASRVVPFPRKKPCLVCADPSGPCDHPREDLCELRIWVLNQEEVQQAVAQAEVRTRKLLNPPKKDEAPTRGYDELRNLHSNIELLFRACRKVDDVQRPFFPAKEHIERYLSSDEIGVLVNLYCHVQAELGPIIGSLTQPEMDAWIARFQEGGAAAYPLDSLSWGAAMALLAYAISTARPSPSSPTDTSSPGQLPDESTSAAPSEMPSEPPA